MTAANGSPSPGVRVMGGGLAGSEAAWQAARLGVPVQLVEMRPGVMTPAHRTGDLAELVCSNSLGGVDLDSPAGLLKEELRRLGSLVLRCAEAEGVQVPAGSALGVDRERFAAAVTAAITGHPLITLVREQARHLPSEPEGTIIVVATGPLTSEALAGELARLAGESFLYFYDAAAPVVTAESVDMHRGWWASRWGKGAADGYFNLALDRPQYEAFVTALATAERHTPHLPDELKFFEGCVPVETLAARGLDTLRYGPMRPVGLPDPRTGRMPYAVVQLRREDREGRLFNLVGFQTQLKWGEQRRVFRMIPGLEQAEFVRYGVIHRNTYVNGPRLLEPTYRMRAYPHLYLAGLLTGVEGYLESAASGLVAGLNAARQWLGASPALRLPPETMIGALARYVTTAASDDFQPMNAAFGLLPPLPRAPANRRARRLAQAERALAALQPWVEEVERWAAEAHPAIPEPPACGPPRS